MDFEKIIKENLRTVIRQRGVTQGWLAEKADTTEATVSRYLTGVHSPRIELIARMAMALNVSVDYLLGLSESSIPNQPPTPEMRAIISSYSRANAFTRKRSKDITFAGRAVWISSATSLAVCSTCRANS